MTIKIDDKICNGISKYCKEKNIDIKKIIEESLIQNQLRHKISMDGNVYNSEDTKTVDKNILEELLNTLSVKTAGELKEDIFGKIYENIEIKNYKYILGDYKSNCKIVIITEDEILIEKIKMSKEIKNIMIEENQSYCWITSYETKVLMAKLENDNGIIIANYWQMINP